MRWHKASVSAIALALCVVFTACDKARDIKPGQSEDEVRGALGAPSLVVTDPRWMPQYFANEEIRKTCVPHIKYVLVFERFIRANVSVGVDGARKVRCVDFVQFGKVMIH